MHPNNTEELLQSAEAWLQQANDDLRQHMEGFMNAENMSPEGLAEVLALTTDEVNAVLNGDIDNVSLRTFAHVLIANGLALAIQPVQETPIGNFGGPRFGTQRRGFMPPPPPPMGRQFMHPTMGPRMGGVRQVRPEDIQPHAVNEPQPRNNRGQFMPRQQRPGAPIDPYMRLSIDALRDIVTRNHWNYEIDINAASREELINFLKGKEQSAVRGENGGKTNGQATQRENVVVNDPPVAENAEKEADGPVGNDGNGNVEAVAHALVELLTSNPELAKTLGSLIPNK